MTRPSPPPKNQGTSRLTRPDRCPLYDRHPVRGSTAGHARRDREGPQARGVRGEVHHRGPRGFHGGARPADPHAEGRRDPDADVELARPRQGRVRPHDLARRPGPPQLPALPGPLCGAALVPALPGRRRGHVRLAFGVPVGRGERRAGPGWRRLGREALSARGRSRRSVTSQPPPPPMWLHSSRASRLTLPTCAQ